MCRNEQAVLTESFVDASLPCSNSSSAIPMDLASCNGVFPSKSFADASLPCSSSNFATANDLASCKAVFPLWFLTKTSALLLSTAVTVATLKPNVVAR
eukprot:m.222027 g.222027  ORF g.222027 m.222027 type:complete len:98 (-) comp26324_c0_seq3:1587-1880(-)